MQIFVYLVAGSSITIECETSDTIEEIKRKIEDRTGIATAQQRLLFAEIQLEDHRILSDLGIRQNSTLHLIKKFRDGCFLSDTLISLSDGTKKRISEIQIGDSLLAFTLFGEIVTTSVEEVFIHDIDEYIELNTGQNMLCVTQEHPFFIGNGNFCALKKLRISDCIYSLVDGCLQTKSIISKKTIVAPTTRVYNLRTAEPHTYFANDVAVHNKLGLYFVDASDTGGLKRHEWGSNSPDEHLANHGLCLEALCTNSHCEAYQKTVIINMGFGQFDLVGGTNADVSKCPICDHYAKPKTCAFNNCKWRWWGIKQPQHGLPPKRISTDWKVADNAYHRLNEDENGSSRWRKLVFKAQKN
ncbi:unnamed protein product [Rotaria sp. Silwood2]|nr:unnamed protein product [Rotaria sp. Silwood2]